MDRRRGVLDWGWYHRTMAPEVTSSRAERSTYIAIALVALVASGIRPHDRGTWFLEVLPVVIALPILIATHRRFPWTRLAYALMLVHGLILMLGGHYTYARVPLGHWFQEAFDLARNHYDRLGHIAQGFVPAILAREVLVRALPSLGPRWRFTFVTSMCLAFSAFYELLEWWTAIAAGSAADAFLGTQGDVWDTQWDMFLALLGAMTAQLALGRLHDRQLGHGHRLS